MPKSLLVLFLLSFFIVDPAPSKAMDIFEGEGDSYLVTEEDSSAKIASLTKEHFRTSRNSLSNEEKHRVALKTPILLATEDRKKEVDLTYVFKKDIVGKDGVILRKKGDSYNPLDTLTMPSLLVIDGENEDQVNWAIEQKEDLDECMILITNGSFLTVARLYQLRVYRLTDSLQARFQITHAPSTVIQEGNIIVVSEYGL